MFNASQAKRWPAITWVMLGVVALRLVHLATSFDSPLFWKPGPDEEFYRAFGRDVAFGNFGLAPELAFMDPFYGYLLGAAFWALGDSLVPVYALQIGVDSLTAWMLFRIGVSIGNPTAGLLAAILHGLTATAMLFTLSLMKATWVAAFVTGWMWLAISLVDKPTTWRWLGMGILLGLGVALRANLILLAAASLVTLPFLVHWRGTAHVSPVKAALVLVLGMLPVLGMLAARNQVISGAPAITPNNGGIVLHHLYNPENPRAGVGLPGFVRYAHPEEIWRAYKAEAETTEGRTLSPKEVDAFWRTKAFEYVRDHPAQTFSNMIRKAGEFIAWPEIPNNRSFEDERRFAPVLAILPAPFGILFALGVPGLVGWWLRDSRALIPATAIAVGLATVMVFFAEDRFRFNVITPFTLGAALALASLGSALSRKRRGVALATALGVLGCGLLTALLGRSSPVVPINWERVAWGYVLMGNVPEAARWVEAVSRDQPDAPGIEEFQGYFALQRGDDASALAHFDRALSKRTRHEVHFNRSLVLERMGRLDDALSDAVAAASLSEQPDYLLRIGQLLKRSGRFSEAGEVFFSILAKSEGDPRFREAAARARREMEEDD